MADLMGGLGGFIKGLKPLMEATGAKEDEGLQNFLVQTDISELKEKKKELLAKIGLAMVNDSTVRARFAAECEEIDRIDKQLGVKQEEAQKAQKALEEKERAEQAARKARTCPSCGFENAEGTKFCSECGGKLGMPSAAFCTQCGTKNEPGTKFCTECGSKL
jgi:hypothetical protein